MTDFFHFTDLHCCKLAVDVQCEEACQDSLRRQFDSDADAVDNLTGKGCGQPSLDVSIQFTFGYKYIFFSFSTEKNVVFFLNPSIDDRCCDK